LIVNETELEFLKNDVNFKDVNQVRGDDNSQLLKALRKYSSIIELNTSPKCQKEVSQILREFDDILALYPEAADQEAANEDYEEPSDEEYQEASTTAEVSAKCMAIESIYDPLSEMDVPSGDSSFMTMSYVADVIVTSGEILYDEEMIDDATAANFQNAVRTRDPFAMKKALKKLTALFHPDKNPDCRDVATDLQQIIGNAMSMLSTKKK